MTLRSSEGPSNYNQHHVQTTSLSIINDQKKQTRNKKIWRTRRSRETQQKNSQQHKVTSFLTNFFLQARQLYAFRIPAWLKNNRPQKGTTFLTNFVLHVKQSYAFKISDDSGRAAALTTWPHARWFQIPVTPIVCRVLPPGPILGEFNIRQI